MMKLYFGDCLLEFIEEECVFFKEMVFINVFYGMNYYLIKFVCVLLDFFVEDDWIGNIEERFVNKDGVEIGFVL